MAWTDERVEELKKLWSERAERQPDRQTVGWCDSQCRDWQGPPSGFVRPCDPVASGPPHGETVPSAHHDNRHSACSPSGRARPAPSASPAAPAPAPVEPAVLPSGEFATVLTLRDSMCKWPIGDPAQAEFRFCGRKTAGGNAYCEAHSSMAYQPSAKRRRRTSDAGAALDAIAATRRYNF